MSASANETAAVVDLKHLLQTKKIFFREKRIMIGIRLSQFAAGTSTQTDEDLHNEIEMARAIANTHTSAHFDILLRIFQLFFSEWQYRRIVDSDQTCAHDLFKIPSSSNDGRWQ